MAIEGDNSPLALNAWDVNGPNSYMAAIEAVDAVIDPEKDSFYRENQRLTNFITNALYSKIRAQSSDNHDQYLNVEATLGSEDGHFASGVGSPAELLLFLGRQEALDSIEIARRTHVRVWNTRLAVDYPVRADLDQLPAPLTERRKSEPVYRIKDLNLVDNSDQHFVLVDRKRTVRQHFGGSVLTIVRNSIILHDHDADMPSEVRDIVLSEREDARRKRKKNEPEYGYNTHIPALYDHLEEHLARRDTNSKPDWIIPILTTYYAVREDKVKEPILKQLS